MNFYLREIKEIKKKDNDEEFFLTGDKEKFVESRDYKSS